MQRKVDTGVDVKLKAMMYISVAFHIGAGKVLD